MHLKSYQIDGKLLRTGAANFSDPASSAPGLRRKQTFEARFASSDALRVGPGQDNNLKYY
jgi:hypothetical protein